MKRAKAGPPVPEPPERRTNRRLREVLDDLVEHVRHVARHVDDMSPDEMKYAQERLEWLADEVWRAAAAGD